MYTICFYNRKGGVGKTSVAGAVASYLSCVGKKVLMIDTDSQGNLSSQFCKNFDFELTDYLSNNDLPGQIEKVIYPTSYENLFIIPTKHIGSDNSLDNWITTEAVKTENSEVFEYLKEDVNKLNFDFVIYDMPPSSTELHKKILLSADEVIPVLQIAQTSIEGLATFYTTLKDLKKRKAKPIFEKIIFNQQDKRKAVQKALMPEIESLSLKKFFLPNDEAFKKAELKGTSVFDLSVKEETLNTIELLSKEIIKSAEAE